MPLIASPLEKLTKQPIIEHIMKTIEKNIISCLEIGAFGLNDADIKCILPLLQANTSIKEIRLYENNISVEQVIAIIDLAISREQIVLVDLEGNQPISPVDFVTIKGKLSSSSRMLEILLPNLVEEKGKRQAKCKL